VSLRLAFMGTPDFAVPALAALIEAGHTIACVYSQPPRPAGRGHRDRPSPVHAFAAERGLEVRTPKSVKGEDAQGEFRALELDAAVVAAYGLILPVPILEAPRLGCVNIHASILPRWRGAAPIERAILAGDGETGVTIMRMDAGLDTGPMLLTETLPIAPDATGGSLREALAVLGSRLVVAALAGLEAGTVTATPQPAEGVTYARKLDKAEARIDWSAPADTVLRQIRAFTPVPGPWCLAAGERLKVLEAAPAEGNGPPGTILADPLVVACGRDAVRLVRVQRAGKGPMAALDLLRGFPLPPGTVVT
jgi:methionyl-tRNA formyltransferase